MTMQNGFKIAEAVTKSPYAGRVLGYGMVGCGVALVLTGVGVLDVTKRIIGEA